MERYKQEYDRFLITDDLRQRFTELQASSEDFRGKTKSILIETVVIDDAPSFTDIMEV